MTNLSSLERKVLEALSEALKLSSAAICFDVPVDEINNILSDLQARGLVERAPFLWRRTPAGTSALSNTDGKL